MKKSNYFFHFFMLFAILIFSENLLAQSDITPLERNLDSRRFNTASDVKPPDNNTDAIIINVPGSYSTIQAAINAANNGDIIQVAAGIYREDLILNKYVHLRGSNYSVNPNTGIRGPETIIQPGTSDPDPNSLTAVNILYITASGSGSIIDGFTFDGDNTLITSGVNMNGADVDAVEAIAAYDGLSNTTISNNIIQNLNYAGIDLYNFNNGGAATYDNIVTNNKFDNIIPSSFGIGVLIYNNCYTSITDNVMTRVRLGVQTGNFSKVDLGTNHSISHNDIESSRLGIFHNLAYTNATTYTIDSNNITTVAGSTNNNGILVSSFQTAVAVNMNDNNVSDARVGINFWNCPTTSTVTVVGGVLSNCNVGVFANNYDGYSSDAATSVYAMTGVTITNCDTAIKIKDNDLNSNNSTVTLNINNSTNIVNGTGIGLLIEGGDAFVVFNGAAPVDFSTSLATYIRLASNGTSEPTSLIDAQSVQFGGANGTALSNAQLFAVEDKIDHKTDWNTLGFVSVKAFNNYVTLNSFYPPNTSVGLIQNGIDIASAGDTVNAGTGTFNENIALNKSVTLKGSGPSSTIIAPLVSCSGNGITISSPNANVNDLRVTDFNYGIFTSSTSTSLYNVESVMNCNYGLNTGNGTNGLTMVKCKFNNNTNGGWRAGTGDLVSNVTMDSCEVKDNNSNPATGFGMFIAASSSISNLFDSITIKNSDFSNNLKKGMYIEKLSNALIDNVIMDNSGTDAAYGFNNGIDINLKYGAYSNITIQNCSITNCGSNGTATDVNNPAALAIKARDDAPSYSSNPASLTGFTLKNCFVTGPMNGLRFGEFDKTNNSPTGNTVIENNFGGAYSNKAIVNKTANNISVSCNWYGSASAPAVIALHSSMINFIPFLTDGTDDNPGAPGFQIVAGSCNGVGPVKNITQNVTYISIQSAVTAANNGDTIEVSSGTYDEQVLVNKGVLIKGVGASMPVVDYTGTVAGKPTLFDVSVRDVKIENMRFRVDMTKLNSAVIASGTDIDNFNITNDSVEAYGSSNAGTFGSYGNRNAISINYGGNINYRIASGGVDNVNVQGLTVSGVLDDGFGVSRYFRAGVSCDEVGGVFNGNTLQTINHDLLVRFGSNGNVDFMNNNFNGGGAEISDMNAGAGVITISDNIFDATFANSSSPGTAVLRLKNNYNFKTTNINRNTISNHQWAVSMENYNTVTLDSNVFTPLANSTVFHHVAVNTKSISTNSNTIVQVPIDAVLTNNVFNYSGTPGGTGLSFHNHDNDAASYGTFNIGTSGNENSFNTGIQNFIYLDDQTGASNTATFPAYTSLIGGGAGTITTMACWTVDLNIENNKFDVGSGLQLPAAMNFSERSTLETNLYHKPDNACLANLTYFMPVHNITQNTYYMTIQAAVNAANPSDQIECAEYSYNERVTIDKKLSIEGVNKTNCVVEGSGLAGTGRGILISNGVKGVTIKNLTVQNFAGANGNTDAGVYAIGGNDSLTISNVIIQNNTGGSGFYANGPINTVVIDSVTSSGHPTGARGIVIWNGLKENITITNCEVFNNNCCGIELQDGQASGVTIQNNNIYDNGDNGIGLVGLQGPGENLVKLNTLLNNGRFGIEIKNPNGSGLATGPGRVVVEDNNVSRNIPIVDNRDIVGIAAFRRGVLAGNVDVPVGAVIQNNTVSGYVQPSVSDGFGIVVEGLNHTVSGNTVSGCDVGIQRQAGHLPAPPLDGDQANLPDQYFGRGNSAQTCGIVIVGNILSNTVDTRDVGAGTGSGIVKNLNTLETFCSIQVAIDDTETLDGHTLAIDSGYYNESVVINKEVELVGAGAAPESRPVVEGVAGQTFSVTAPNVTINNIIVKFNQGSVNTGIRAATSGTFNNLTVKKSCVFGTATTGVVIFNSFGIQTGTFGGVQYDQVTLDSNEIKHIGTSPLGRGVKTFNCYGDWSNSNISAFYSIQCGDIQGGLLNITNDSLFGTNEINSLGTGSHTFSNNVCNVANAYGSGTDYALLELKNISNGTANLLVSGNTFENFVNFGVFSGRSNNVTIDNNTFTPDPTAPYFRSIRLDTKQRTTAPQGVFVSGAVITKNTFNGNAALGQAGISLQLANSDSISSFGTVSVGGSGNENNFNNNVLTNIHLNNETTSTSGDPVWYATYISTKGKVKVNIDARDNNYDVGAGLQLPNAMTLANLFMLEDKIQHKIDDGGLGFVLAKTNNDYVTVNSFVAPTITTPSVQRGIDAASAGFTVNVGPGSFTEQLEINKALTLDGQGSGITNIVSPNTLTLSYTTSGVNKPVVYIHDASDVTISDLTVDGNGKGNANNRFQGIGYRNAGGTVDSCEVKAIRNTPIDGVQAGVGIYAIADDGNPRTLNVIGNNIHDFQKNATVFAGADLSVRADSNTITGAGPVSFIAQNGIQLSFGAAGSIRYNNISGISYVPSTYVSTGILLYQSAGPDTTSHNVLTGCQMGIYYIDVGGVISENTITTNSVNTGTTSYWGIDADPGGTPRVKPSPADEPAVVSSKQSGVLDNSSSISTWIFRNVLNSTGNNGVGIEMDALGTETLNATASENYVNGWEAGIFFYKDAGATLNGVANENELSNNTYFVYNQTGVIQNATCNWYGTTDPPTIAAGMSGIVNYAPYLTNGTDSDAPTMGFQPVPASCNGNPASTINIKVIPQGFYNTSTQTLNMRDTVRAYLHSIVSPYNVLDSAISVIDSVTFTGAFTFNQPTGTYYIVVKHRNSIETWSKSGGEPFVAASVMNYDFTDLSSKAYDNNMTQVDSSPLRFGIFSGDVNQDGIVELTDINITSNDMSTFVTGYVDSDVTGNNVTELSDLVIVYNNASGFVVVKNP